jgi:3-oxoacyl-[acyl-carrier-protein] synthase-3
MYKSILVIGSELHSTGLDMTTRGRNVSVIFGDGAGAAVLTREEDLTKVYCLPTAQQGQYAEELSLIAPGMGKLGYRHPGRERSGRCIVLPVYEWAVCV